MHRLFLYIVVGSLLFSLIARVECARAENEIVLPLRFHLVTGLAMTKQGQVMNSWVTEADIGREILPELKRIWNPAGIRFRIDSIEHSPSLHPKKRAQLLDAIVHSRRDATGKSDPKRIKKLLRLVDMSTLSTEAINVYFVPYLGEKSQGNTKASELRIFVGEWSDKTLDKGRAPNKRQLVERGPLVRGSLARTIAHEIGHVLGLKHPDKRTQTTFGLLMGGKRAGYSLTAEDISIARSRAIVLSKRTE